MSPVVDVHTHMFPELWLELLRERGGPHLEVRASVDSPTTIFRHGASFCVLESLHFDYEARIQNMDAAGVDVAVMTLPAPSVFWGDEQTSTRAARLANDSFADAQSRYPSRVRWMASLPWEFPERATVELHRACELGAVGVLTLGNVNGRALTDAVFDPIWRAIDERELPVLVHPTVPPGADELELTRFAMVASVGFMVDTSVAVTRLIFDGFFDRYAKLKLIAAHAGGTLPYLAGRLDRVFERTKRGREKIGRPPSEYLRRIYYDSVTYTTEALGLCVQVGGADRVLYGSDYPFNIGDMVGCLARVRQLPEHQRGAVLGDNALRIFNL